MQLAQVRLGSLLSYILWVVFFFHFLYGLKVIIFPAREEPVQRNAIRVRPKGTSISLTRNVAHNVERPPGKCREAAWDVSLPRSWREPEPSQDARALLEGSWLMLMLRQIRWEETGKC